MKSKNHFTEAAIVKMSARNINVKDYGALLLDTLPRRIDTKEENEKMLARVEKLMEKGKRRTAEESILLDLLVTLIQVYEERAYPLPSASPLEVLKHLMEANEVRQADLASIFGSRGYVSDVVNGKRGISKEAAKSLGEFFHVSPAVFL